MRKLYFFFCITVHLAAQKGPSYKFGVIDGEPIDLINSTSVQVKDFDECVEKCEEDFECILAYQKSDSEPCHLFPWDTISGVKGNESGVVGQVAFRVYTDQPACELNLPRLLNGKKYPIYENNTIEYLWTIDTSEEGWKISYIRTTLDDNLRCGNWSFFRPYIDGCDANCLVTMVQDYAKPGPETVKPRDTQISNWDDCMHMCYEEEQCQIAYLDSDAQKCVWYSSDDGLTFMNKSSADSGKRLVIKMKVDETTCKFTTPQLLDSFKFGSQSTEPSTTEISTTEGTPKQSCKDADARFIPGVEGCYMMVRVIPKTPIGTSDLTNNEAQQQCLEIGGDGLMTVATNDSLSYFKKGDIIKDDNRIPRYHLGLIKNDGTWTWRLPQLKIDQSPIPWTTNQRPVADTEKCGYAQLLPDTAGMASCVDPVDCDDPLHMNGYICHFPKVAESPDQPTATTTEMSVSKQSCKDTNARFIPAVEGCYKMVRVIPKDLVLSSDITNNEAQEQCLDIGGDGLMTVATNDTLNYFLKGDYLEDIKMTPRFHVGIIKKDDTWTWRLPQLKIDQSPIPWSLNTRKVADTEKCGYVQLPSDPLGFRPCVEPVDCDDPMYMNGYICHFPKIADSPDQPTATTTEMSVPKQSCKDADARFIPGVQGCYKMVFTKDKTDPTMNAFTSHEEAAGNCTSIGGNGLMTVATNDSMKLFKTGILEKWHDFWWVGLIKKDSNWTWMLPELVTDNTPIPWARDQKFNEGDDCGYVQLVPDRMQIKDEVQPFSCNVPRPLKGYICHFVQ